MHSFQKETYTAVETALHFALKGEERLNRLCQEKHNPFTSDQTYEVEGLLEQWRHQKRICERLAKTLYNLNPEFTHPAFNPATLDGKGVCYLKTFIERRHEGALLLGGWDGSAK